MLTYAISAIRGDAQGSHAVVCQASLVLDPSLVELSAERQDAPPKLITINYVLTVDPDEIDRRLELLHTNVRKYGTISNTLAGAVALTGTIVRAG